ncbi:hypothetical protein BKA63DRAFT_222958 [Paraphoma chrysanthemicola]|nr:hypothetical protein BKA63DRAFT_222958 [Paraphoma chrysanthemicola]
MKVYMSGGTVYRKKQPPRRVDEDIFSSDLFFEFHKSSMRAATEPRDYIFATMPQFPWYHYPENAKNMSFNDIFADFHRQATVAGHDFAPRITKSMTHAERGTTQEEAWYPSTAQPEPRHLGDFLKLLGDGLDSTFHHLATVASVVPIVCANNIHEPILALIKSAMKFSSTTWFLSLQGGELGSYGAQPDWPAWLTQRPRSHDGVDGRDVEAEVEELRNGTGDWLISQAVSILCLMFGSFDSHLLNERMRGEWPYFLHRYEGCWSSRLLQVMVIHAAMISCQIPLSAYHWLIERFVPVEIRLPSGLDVLGFDSKLAMNFRQPGSKHEVSIAGRQTSLTGIAEIARNIVLVDPESKVPIGLLPDFTYVGQGREEFLKRTKLLYGDRVLVIDGQIVHALTPLDSASTSI